ncbi:hypothetical protein LXL04_024473 [Taraxacum kok-saghyz]
MKKRETSKNGKGARTVESDCKEGLGFAYNQFTSTLQLTWMTHKPPLPSHHAKLRVVVIFGGDYFQTVVMVMVVAGWWWTGGASKVELKMVVVIVYGGGDNMMIGDVRLKITLLLANHYQKVDIHIHIQWTWCWKRLPSTHEEKIETICCLIAYQLNWHLEKQGCPLPFLIVNFVV